MSFEMNENDLYEILNPYFDGQYFKGVPAVVLQQLLDKGLADPESCQNNSPTIKKFLTFITTWQFASVHGYIDDGDSISIEGIDGNIPTDITKPNMLAFFADFVDSFPRADESEVDEVNGYFRVWYD